MDQNCRGYIPIFFQNFSILRFLSPYVKKTTCVHLFYKVLQMGIKWRETIFNPDQEPISKKFLLLRTSAKAWKQALTKKIFGQNFRTLQPQVFTYFLKGWVCNLGTFFTWPLCVKKIMGLIPGRYWTWVFQSGS